MSDTPGLHVAIIMDGNGRLGTRRGLPRSAGHRAGAEAVRRVTQAAPDLGVATLTLFAFSCANWRRPSEEVEALMGLLRGYLKSEARRLVESGARLTMLGRRDRLPKELVAEIGRIEAASASGRRLNVRIALDYSSREAIAQAATSLGPAGSIDDLARMIAGAPHDDAGVGAVDLMIRTGGEKRLSDFLLWECAYAELWFTDKMWPDFGAEDLARAIDDFHQRERTFGAVPVGVAARRAAGPAKVSHPFQSAG
ncbi:MAG: polyprenyl diphosphate synthase [Caulobacterales bacterium]